MSLFLLVFGLLLIEGWCIATLLIGRTDRLLCIGLSLPLASLVNALIIFLFTVVRIPLSVASIIPAHMLVIGASGFFAYRQRGMVIDAPAPVSWSLGRRADRIIGVLCILLLTSAFAFSVIEALWLPTQQIDSLTNWTMRSRVSWEDQAIAFDATEERGVAKPQYPILFHGLQIVANALQREWSDRAANAATWLLTLGSFVALFVLLRRLRGPLFALVSLALIVTVPLLSMHLAQGYADLPLALFVLLAAASLAQWRHSSSQASVGGSGWLLLAALLTAAAAWTKTEGLVIGVVPFLLLLGYWWFREPMHRRPLLWSALATILVSIPYPVFLLIRGMRLTPHDADASLRWSTEGFLPMLSALFGSGSLGVSMYVILGLLLVLALQLYRGTANRSHLWLLAWGGTALGIVIFTYLFTPNITFLLNQQSFFRQALAPVSLLMLGVPLLLRVGSDRSPSEDS